MSMDALQKVIDAEDRAKEDRAKEEERRRRLRAEAESAGRTRLENAQARMEQQMAEALKDAEIAASGKRQAIRGKANDEANQLRALAGGRLEQAGNLIVERILGD